MNAAPPPQLWPFADWKAFPETTMRKCIFTCLVALNHAAGVRKVPEIAVLGTRIT